MPSDDSNLDFQLAARFVNQTGRSIFLTGKAGTGKTTFLQFIRENTFKKLAVVAPTGVAAINAGGTTMHSFFQLPFGPFVPAPQYGWNVGRSGVTDPNSLFANIRFNANKRELLQELELLIIDEISMVRADTLDAVDAILRHFRQQPLAPFGGVQVLYIGDLFQLPPVISQEEWQLLKEYYNSPFFFDAKVIREQPPIYIELKKIYRQKEAVFIDILNNIRNNRATPYDLEKLHDHYEPDFMSPKDSSYITLTSHNARAEHINQAELGRIRGKLHAFEATVTGEFNDKAYPAEKTLQLKEGAQIMLIKNDKGETRRYFNGKIGKIKNIGEKITIQFPDEPDDLVLEKEIWRNIRYKYNREKDKIEEEELGTFSQYPIRLAWAITIHKSQGLTFDKAVIDAGGSFAPGQVYVALSRLRSIDGLILQSRIPPSAISTDPRVIEYTDSRMSDHEIRTHLLEEQHTYIHNTLQKAFDWTRITSSLLDHHTAYDHRQIPVKIKAITLSAAWLEKSVHQQETAQKFSRQLDLLLYSARQDGYQQLQQRMQAATAYFLQSLDEDQIKPLQQHIEEVKIQKKIKKYLTELQELKAMFTRRRQQLEDALQMVDGLQKGLDTTQLLSGLQEARKNRETPPPAATTATPTPTPGKTPKGETHRISLHLYKAGIPIAEIAARRNLAVTTVEGHLATFIPTGEIDIKELVPEEKIDTIRTTFSALGNTTLNALKARLGDNYSFGEIRAVLASIRATNPSSSTPPSNSSQD
ncbi:MAG: helix-turn-helix domain-containing protein [Chitinophagaceae bacterium]|nr:helix-turn-helix domain-containing protein [Chitinophagaceae bacterium]